MYLFLNRTIKNFYFFGLGPLFLGAFFFLGMIFFLKTNELEEEDSEDDVSDDDE